MLHYFHYSFVPFLVQSFFAHSNSVGMPSSDTRKGPDLVAFSLLRIVPRVIKLAKIFPGLNVFETTN